MKKPVFSRYFQIFFETFLYSLNWDECIDVNNLSDIS